METFYHDNQIIFISSLIPAYSVLGIGFLSMFFGLIFFRKIYKRIRLFWILFGAMLLCLGLLDLEMGVFKKITIDGEKKELIINERRYFGELVETRIAFDNFSHLEVLRDWSVHPNAMISTTDFKIAINLVRHGLKPIELGIYSDQKYLLELVNKLRTTVNFPVYLIGNGLDKNFNSFTREFSNVDNVEILYRYEQLFELVPLMLDSLKITPPKYELPHPVNVTVEQGESETMVMWNNMHNVFWILLVGICTFSGLHLMHYWLLYKHGFSVGFALIYSGLIITAIVWCGFVLTSLFGVTRVEFNTNNVIYSNRIFGITAFKQTTAKVDLSMSPMPKVINTINPDDNQLSILTNEGYMLISKSMESTMDSVAIEVKRAQSSPLDYRVIIDVSGLTTGERLFLEEELHKNTSY